MNLKFSEEEISEMYEEYRKGSTLKELGIVYGVRHETMGRYFKTYDLPTRTNKEFEKFSKKEILEMHGLYVQGLSSIKIAKIYKTNPSSVLKWFHKYKLEVRTNKENSKIYNFNENYFENIDSSDKAYWLGFIYADGYITTKRKYESQKLGISLAKRDECLLKKFKKCISSDHKIKTYTANSGYSKGSDYCRITISSQKIVDDLKSQGVIENKTDILKAPNIDEDNIKHFIRGYIDGDGSIYKVKNKSGKYDFSVSLVGTDDVLTYIHSYFKHKELVKKELNLEKRKTNHIVSNIRYGGNLQVYNILSHIYNNSDIYLNRKYNVYLDLKQTINR